jgi:vacuolar-type H+-ATPase subunit I/STV1
MKKIILNLAAIAFMTSINSILFGQELAEKSVEAMDSLKDTQNEVAYTAKDFGRDQKDLEEDQKEMEETQKNLKKAHKDFLLDYHKFKNDSEAKFISNEIRIADLKEEIMKMNVKDKSAEYQKKVSDLAQKNNKLKKELADYEDDGPEEWALFKIVFTRDTDELGKALKDITINTNK